MILQNTDPEDGRLWQGLLIGNTINQRNLEVSQSVTHSLEIVDDGFDRDIQSSAFSPTISLTAGQTFEKPTAFSLQRSTSSQ
jgi:hypothetical protein